jgi:hypothetical protein
VTIMWMRVGGILCRTRGTIMKSYLRTDLKEVRSKACWYLQFHIKHFWCILETAQRRGVWLQGSRKMRSGWRRG